MEKKKAPERKDETTSRLRRALKVVEEERIGPEFLVLSVNALLAFGFTREQIAQMLRIEVRQ